MSTALQRRGRGCRGKRQSAAAKNLDTYRPGRWTPTSPQHVTFLHGDVHGAGVGGLQQLLVRLGRLVEELHQQGARLLVLAPPDGGQLIQLLLHQPGVVQGVLQAVPAGRAESA